jgi:hypothetical protein
MSKVVALMLVTLGPCTKQPEPTPESASEPTVEPITIASADPTLKPLPKPVWGMPKDASAPKDGSSDASALVQDGGAKDAGDASKASADAGKATDAGATGPSDAGANKADAAKPDAGRMAAERKAVAGKCDAGWIIFPTGSETCRKSCTSDSECGGLTCAPKGSKKLCR